MQQIYDIQDVIVCEFSIKNTISVRKPSIALNISTWISFNNENTIFLSTFVFASTDITRTKCANIQNLHRNIHFTV